MYGFPYWLPKSNLYCAVCADPDNRVRETLRLLYLTVSVLDLDTMAVITAMRTSSVAAHAAPAVRSAPVTLVAEPPLTPPARTTRATLHLRLPPAPARVVAGDAAGVDEGKFSGAATAPINSHN